MCGYRQILVVLSCLLIFGVRLGGTQGSGDVTVISTEGSDAVLPCSLATKENIESKLFDWTKAAQKDGLRKEVFYYRNGIQNNGQSEEFKGRVFHFQDELKNGNASIIIRNTKINDTGNYTCVFPKLQDPQTKQLIVANKKTRNCTDPQRPLRRKQSCNSTADLQDSSCHR